MAKSKSAKKDLIVLKKLASMIANINKSFFGITLMRTIVIAVIPLLNVILPSLIIDEIVGQERWNMLLLYVCVMLTGNLTLGMIKTILDRNWNLANKSIQHGLEVNLGKHIMTMDYEKIEDPTVLDMKEQALYPIRMQNSLNELIETSCNLVTVMCTLASFAIILLQTNFTLFLGVLLFCGIQYLLLIKIQKNLAVFYEKIPVTMRQSVYYENIAADYKPLKEIQVYRAKDLLLEKLKNAHQINVDLFQNSFSQNGKYEGLMGCVSQLQLVFVYAYNIFMLVAGRITLGNFTLFINTATKFAENVMSAVRNIVVIHQDCRYLQVYLDFMDLESIDDNREDNGQITSISKFEIEFRNVSFHYPRQEEMILKDVSVTIRSGERVSIVGMNGAGKTTFVKLLCRLLVPTSGEIYINGVNINQYSIEEYQQLIAAVFQDFKIFSFSIKENVDVNGTGKDIREALHSVGLERWINKYSGGIETQLTRRFYEDGVEPSGGEGQKLAMARAVFKDSPIMVLDEPTAALDPYAEYEIYKKFDEIGKGKTVIYISHRLGYCLLSDRILVFEKGRIVEQGTHEELKCQGGNYTRLWKSQAQYYMV